MKKPLNLQDVFKKTRASVYDASKGTQFPAIYDQIVKGDFYFTLPNIKPIPPKSEPVISQVVKPKPVIVQPTPVISGASFKWITPTNKKVTWKKAKELCRENGARLPSRKELGEVVTNCGGILTDDFYGTDANKNKNNNRYQGCYKKKGFNSNNYWSSTRNVRNGSDAWIVYFRNGNQYHYGQNNNNYVRCIRGR